MAKKNTNKKERTHGNTGFFKEFGWWFVALIGGLIVAYVIVYVCFRGNGFLSAGNGLEKRDWLSFLGAYFCFAGTLIISLFASLQSRFFVERDNKRIAVERKLTIQPILSVRISAIDSMVIGTAEVFNFNKPATFPQHRNATIAIENAGQFPICNVIVFDKYVCQMLKPSEKTEIQVAYSDSPDVQKWKDKIIELNENEYAKTSSGIPKWFNINYDDIDGNEMFQTFTLKEFNGTFYYSLERTEETASRNYTV